MQLIFETDHTPDINTDMSTLEESVDEKLITDAIMDSLKHISNGNKENIEKPDNISRNEKNARNSNKLEDDLTVPAIEINVEEVNEVEIIDEEDLNSNCGENLNDELLETTEPNKDCDIKEQHLIKKEEECSTDNLRNGCENEIMSELQQVKEEVNSILSREVDNLINNTETDEVPMPRSVAEESHDDVIKTMKENLIQSIATELIFDDDGSSEKMLEENPTPVEVVPTKQINDSIIVNDDDQENEVVENSAITEEATTSTVTVSTPEIEKEDTNSTRTKIKEDQQDSSCTETVTITEDNDIIDKMAPETMNVDEVCKEIDIISDKEDNEITVLDSPVNGNVNTNEDEHNSSNIAMDCDLVSELVDNEPPQDATFIASKDEVMIIDKAAEISQKDEEKQDKPPQDTIEKEPEKAPTKSSTMICRLSNSLNILSDDEDESTNTETSKDAATEKPCIHLEDDDDIMLIDEDTSSKDSKTEKTETNKKECESASTRNEEETDLETGEKTNSSKTMESSTCTVEEATSSTNEPAAVDTNEIEKVAEETTSNQELIEKPLLPDNFLKLSRKNIADMTREELEEFCILKIVESIVDRSNLSEIKTKLKTMAQSLEDYKKKAMMLTKQTRDLEIVLKSVQEEQKRTSGSVITPLKITRSVGMQVFMTDKLIRKKSLGSTTQPPVLGKTRSSSNLTPKPNKVPSSPTIPVPRLIPANNAAIKGPASQSVQANTGKPVNTVAVVNGMRVAAPAQKHPEKRPLTKSQSVTVDLTDDEPPSKLASRGPTPPVRLVPSQNLLATQRAQFGQTMSTPRKVYIPISGPQGQHIKPGQTIMVKTSAAPTRQRPVAPTITRLSANQVRMNRPPTRHPAPLPDVVKQYQPPNWKALPPAPDLKLSKVQNGIVISWKIDGYQEDSYEEIASYQLYAYQETPSPPSTSLWKKIGDVKALPLPMACTLTQFMAGFKYYFAVRAVDVKSRVGPFSLPGSILLLNKM